MYSTHKQQQEQQGFIQDSKLGGRRGGGGDVTHVGLGTRLYCKHVLI